MRFITKHGRPVAVLVDIDDFRRSHDKRPSFAEFLLADLDVDGLELPMRSVDPDRVIDLLEAEG